MSKTLGILVLAVPITAYAGFVVEEGAMPAPAVAARPESASAPKAGSPAATDKNGLPSSEMPPEQAAEPEAPPLTQSPTINGVTLNAVTFLGLPDKEPPVMQGFGTDVRLVDAVRRVVPPEWQVFWSEEAIRKNVRDQKVAWSDGRTWVEILNGFGLDYGLQFDVKWERKQVNVGDNGKPLPAKTWTLREGHMVGRELKAWGESTTPPWTVEWKLPKDYVVPARTTFSGDFKSVASEAIKSLAANGVLIRGRFFDGNQTLLISGPGVAEQ